jgi:TrmH family RNA methyltransferase
MGSILREHIIYLEDIKKIKEMGYTLVGTVLDENSISLENLKKSKKMAFIMGNEANGISQEIKNLCDVFVKIPMSGNAESLNVAVATSIILYKQFEKNE